jgi:predicted SnoaL-like aldol condensation-catalyzing enzyme
MFLVMISVVAMVTTSTSAKAQTISQTSVETREANKQLVTDFFAFEGDREERALQFMTDDYIQHNPRFLKMDEFTGASGSQAWVEAGLEARDRGIRLVELGGIGFDDPVLFIAEGDLVTAIYRGELDDPTEPGGTYEAFAFETFRVRDGRFSEHWDQVTLAPGWMDSVR